MEKIKAKRWLRQVSGCEGKGTESKRKEAQEMKRKGQGRKQKGEGKGRGATGKQHQFYYKNDPNRH